MGFFVLFIVLSLPFPHKLNYVSFVELLKFLFIICVKILINFWKSLTMDENCSLLGKSW